MNAPLVSCLLATRDAAETVGTAVSSLLAQTVAEVEVVVVDDGSTDRTAELLDGLDDRRIVVVRNEASVGLAAALNTGLERARGRYVARLDADDVAWP